MKLHSILTVALSGIGDALMFSPALRLLREKYPETQIDILCMFKGVEELYKRNPDISNVLYWDFLSSSIPSSFSYLLKLRGKYDATISVYPQNRWEYNSICFLIGAKYRLGHIYNHLNAYSLSFLNNHRIHELDSRHNVEENIELVKLLGVNIPQQLPPLQVHLTNEDIEQGNDWLASQNLSHSLLVGFHAGSAEFKNHINRRWAPEKYAELGLRLIREKNASILLFGGSDEYALNEKINSAMENKGVIVKTPFMLTAALMSQCKLFVCNDTGLMHLAAGLQLPIVTIFAYTNPSYVYPWKTRTTMVRHPLECSPCFYYSPRPVRCRWKEDRFRCITHIEVDEVWNAVNTMLDTSAPKASIEE